MKHFLCVFAWFGNMAVSLCFRAAVYHRHKYLSTIQSSLLCKTELYNCDFSLGDCSQQFPFFFFYYFYFIFLIFGHFSFIFFCFLGSVCQKQRKCPNFIASFVQVDVISEILFLWVSWITQLKSAVTLIHATIFPIRQFHSQLLNCLRKVLDVLSANLKCFFFKGLVTPGGKYLNFWPPFCNYIFFLSFLLLMETLQRQHHSLVTIFQAFFYLASIFCSMY